MLYISVSGIVKLDKEEHFSRWGTRGHSHMARTKYINKDVWNSNSFQLKKLQDNVDKGYGSFWTQLSYVCKQPTKKANTCTFTYIYTYIIPFDYVYLKNPYLSQHSYKNMLIKAPPLLIQINVMIKSNTCSVEFFSSSSSFTCRCVNSSSNRAICSAPSFLFFLSLLFFFICWILAAIRHVANKVWSAIIY